MNAAPGLDVPLAGQTVWFGWSVAFGAAAMLLYTLVRALTRRARRGPVLAAADLLFALLLGGLEFGFLVLVPQNKLRWFYLVGQLLGAVLFWSTAAPVFFRFFGAFERVLSRFWGLFVRLFRRFWGKRRQVAQPPATKE